MTNLKDLESKLDSLKNELEKTQKAIEDYKKNDDYKHEPKSDSDFYYSVVIDPNASEYGVTRFKCDINNTNYNNYNTFRTEEESEQMLKKIQVLLKAESIYKWITKDYSDDSLSDRKHYINYHTRDGFGVYGYDCFHDNSYPFKSKEDGEKFIELMGEDLKIFFRV